jgi:predicted metal-dependent enzyme (double-stranded beta helix superfamily)
MLRGAELSQQYTYSNGAILAKGRARRLEPGDVELLSPAIGDIHQVSNAYADRASISVHAYGANIGAIRRSAFNVDGSAKAFTSGYSNDFLPNPWRHAPRHGDEVHSR